MNELFPFVDLRSQYQRLKPRIDERIRSVLEHGQFVAGPEVAELERRLQEWVGGSEVITSSNGSDALLMALMAIEVAPGDAVFLPAFTFPATAEAVLLRGATPIFVDVDRETFNISTGHLTERIEAIQRAGKLRPRAVIPVDLFGRPADHDAIASLAASSEMTVIDDAAQALGARLGDRPVGALAPLTATSFFPAKPLGAYGDGGAVFARDADCASRLRSIRDHGQGDHRYEIVRVGINGRLDSLQAAVLLVKLEVFSDELESRAILAERYSASLKDSVQVPILSEDVKSAWAQYSIVLDERERVLDSLRDAAIPSAIYYPRPMHLQPAYAAYGDGEGSLPVSEYLSRHILSLPMHPYLSDELADRVIDAVLKAAR